MAERDRFELDLAAALRGYALAAPTDVRPAELANEFAASYPRGRGVIGRWRFGLSPSLAWALLVAGMLVALVVGGLVVGTWRPTPALVIAPSPSPTPGGTLRAQGSEILATTRAAPVPAQATCPPGSNPDAPGPVDQVRPANLEGAQAFDRRAGRIVLLASDERPGPRTWTFDVCTNTWQRMNPPVEPGWADPVTLVYDADSDRTLAFAPDRVWSYDPVADRWTVERRFMDPIGGIAGWGPGDRTAAVYHDPSGLVIAYDGQAMWAYDVEANTMTLVRQLPDPEAVGRGLPDGVTMLAYDRARDLLLAAAAAPAHLRNQIVATTTVVDQVRDWLAGNPSLVMWAFDPGTGTWRQVATQVPAGVLWQRDGWFYGPVSRVVFDATSGATLFLSWDGWVEADDGQRSWSVAPASGDPRCASLAPVYDSLHGRIVCQAGGGGVSAFTTATGEWAWLVEPQPE